MSAYIKTEDVLNVILESRTLADAYRKVGELPQEDAVSFADIGRLVESLKAERDGYEFRSEDWKRVDDEIDSVEWVVRELKGE